jgi:hypothetical protein
VTFGRWIGALQALLIIAGCGSPSPPPAASEMRVLATTAVPGLPSTTTVLTAVELSKDASIPGLAAMLSSWGYVDGRERVFQGESRHLSLVVSRLLIFKDAGGASTYVRFVQSNASAFFGVAVTIEPLVAQGRTGFQFTPAACACHMANPAIVGVLDAGTSVVWLEINGPDATPALLLSLLDPAQSVPATLS